jgi:hypothetical protein
MMASTVMGVVTFPCTAAAIVVVAPPASPMGAASVGEPVSLDAASRAAASVPEPASTGLEELELLLQAAAPAAHAEQSRTTIEVRSMALGTPTPGRRKP